MVPIYGPITPYRRLCGSIFIVAAAALVPLVHFAVSLAISLRAAQWSIFAVLASCALVLLVPPARQITQAGSVIALVVAMLAAAIALGCMQSIQRAVASVIGFYDDALPWSDARFKQPTWTYRNPFAEYTLQIPDSWQQSPGPLEGTAELLLHGHGPDAVAARLRPTCDLSTEPLPVEVQLRLKQQPQLQRHCGLWNGLQTCLLEHQARGGATQVEWLARRPDGDAQMRLTFELFDAHARGDALAIIHSATASFKAAACPNPVEWAEPFE